MRTPGIIALVLIVMIPVFLSTTTLLMKASPNETPILYFVAATISLPRNVSSNCMKVLEVEGHPSETEFVPEHGRGL